MRTHHAIRPAAPGFTGGGDGPEPACLGRWDVFDRIIDREHGPAAADDLQAAWAMCESCPLRLRCHVAHHDEPWVAAMQGRPRRVQQVTGRTVSADVRNRIGEQNRLRSAAKNAERLRELRHLIDAGCTLAEVTFALGISRPSLHEWCKRHGHMNLYRRIGPGRGAPGRKRGAA